MKKTLVVVLFVLCLSSFASAAVVDDAITWMYNKGLTLYNNTSDFGADRGLRRDEAAKFFVNFSNLLDKTDYVKTASQCIFADINDAWSDLKDTVIESCRLGLFQGDNGMFKPKSQLTNAQAITVLVRLLTGYQSEIGANHRADNYYAKANELNILQNTAMNSKNSIATRANVGIIIYNSNNIYSRCIQEGGISNASLGPQYYKPCCNGLTSFNPYPEGYAGGGAICQNPDKGTPLCQQVGTSNEGRYYSDGTLLKKDTCSTYTNNNCIQEGGISNPSLGPQYFKPCCSGLKGFNPYPDGYDGGGAICQNPNKGTPLCQQVDTSNEGRYYSDGILLMKFNCGIYLQ